MNTKKFLKSTAMAAAAFFAMTACKKDEPGETINPIENGFFISATSGTGGYLLAVEDVTSGEVSVVGNGLEVETNYTWLFPEANIGIGLKYQQGDPGLGLGVTLGTDGHITRKGSEFQIASRFTTYGTFKGQVVTIVGGVTDPTNPTVISSTFNFVNPASNNAVVTKTISTTNLTGNGEYATLSGLVEFGDEFLTSIVPSSIGAATGDGGASTGPSAYPDSLWVVAFDKDLKVKRVYGDNRLGYASGRFRSQYYSTIAPDDKGNVYVFSPANDATSTKPAGVIRINKGENSFDQSYFWNIENASGGIKFRKVFHIEGDYYLIQMFNTTETAGLAPSNRLAVVNVVSKSFKWVENLPTLETITSVGQPISEKGKMYVPVSANDVKPAIYIIDPATATAVKGLEVDADAVTAIGKLAKN